MSRRLNSLIEPLEPRYAPAAVLPLFHQESAPSGTEHNPLSAPIAGAPALPTLTISNVSHAEGSSDTTYSFVVTLSEASATAVTVAYATSNDTATLADNDFLQATGTLTFAPNETTKNITVTVKGDTKIESDEAFKVVLSNPSGATVVAGGGVGTITNDDTSISIGDATIIEGNSGTSQLQFTITLSDGLSIPLTVKASTADNTAKVGELDYLALTQDITFQPGEKTKTFTVTVNGDAVAESDETFFVNLSNPTSGTITDGQAVGKIRNDENKLTIIPAGSNPTAEGGAGGASIYFFEIKLDQAATGPVTVQYIAGDGTAQAADDDYAPVTGLVTFAPGETSKMVSVAVIGDDKHESNETFKVTLANETNAIIETPAAGTATATIVNDDPQPTISISKASVAEGSGQETNPFKLVYTITLSNPSSEQITVTATTADGTATVVGMDYFSNTQDLVFAPGETTKTFEVTVKGDTAAENDETVLVNLTNPVNATLGTAAQGTGTILDDESARLRVSDVTIVEGDNGTKNAVFTVSYQKGTTAFNAPAAFSFKVNTQDGTATAGSDYQALVNQVVNFANGASSQTISVPVYGDTADELSEQFSIALSDVSGGVLVGNNQATATILNDDLKVFISDASVIEGNGTTSVAQFTVTLSAPSSHDVTIIAKTIEDTGAGAADAGVDYYTKTTLITIPAGQTVGTFAVTVRSDVVPELNEHFSVQIEESNDPSKPTNAQIGVAKARGTIMNDEAVIRVSNGVVLEGGAGSTKFMEFVVTLENGLASGDTTVQIQTADITGANAATAGTDYTAIVSQTLTFAAGTTTQKVLVPILGDTTAETSERFNLVLSNPSGAMLIDGQSTGVGTIVDDDTAKQGIVTISDAFVTEGEAGVAEMVFVVRLVNTPDLGTNEEVIVDYTIVDGTARGGEDYVSPTGTTTLKFAKGETTKTISVGIRADGTFEGSEQFMVQLTANTNAAILDDVGVGTISDLPLLVNLAGGTGAEGTGAGNGGKVPFKVTLSQAPTSVVTVQFVTSDGSAVGSDYTTKTATVTFQPYQTSQTILVDITPDGDQETDETIIGTISNPQGATLGNNTTATGIIQNDEQTVSIGNVNVVEGASSNVAKVDFTLSGASLVPVTVRYVVENGTAVAGSDFSVNTIQEVVFMPGDPLTKSINVLTTIDDNRYEGDETATVRIVSVTNAAPTGTGTATVTITDDDALTVSVQPQVVFEGETAVTPGPATLPGKLGGPFVENPTAAPVANTVKFKVSLNRPSDVPVTVLVDTVSGTALPTAGEVKNDYEAITTQLVTFNPGQTTADVSVTIYDDAQTAEPVENFKLQLSSPTGGATLVGDGAGEITILDDDLRGISIADASVAEGDSGTTDLTFKVTIPFKSDIPITINYTTIDTGAVSVGANADYMGQTGSVIIQPGQTEALIVIKVNGDQVIEGDETFVLRLTSVVNDIIVDGDATGTIEADDTKIELLGATKTVTEDGTQQVTFEVKRTGDTSQINRVFFTTADGVSAGPVGAASAAKGDYVAQSGFLEFAPGDPDTKTITVTILDDSDYEGDEQFFLRLTGATNAVFLEGGQIKSELQGVIKIEHDGDARPTLSINDVRLNEGSNTSSQGGQTDFVFTVSLSAANELEDVTVNFSSLLSLDNTARSEAGGGFLADYVGLTSGMLTFAKGEKTKTITVKVNQDTRDEDGEETFRVKLENGVNATITDDVGVGTIVDDDAAPTLVFDGSDPTVVEGDSGETVRKLKLKLSAPSERSPSVLVSLVNGTAVTYPNGDPLAARSDYKAGADVGIVTFGPDQTEKEISVIILGDSVDESNESFSVKVAPVAGNAQNPIVVITDDTAIVTITDDDLAPVLAINNVTTVEGNDGTKQMVFTVSLTGLSDREITTHFETALATGSQIGQQEAAAEMDGPLRDFLQQSGTLSFPAYSSESKTISVTINGDSYKELDEVFAVKLSNPTNATIANATGIGKILQDGDTTIGLYIKDARAVEGKSVQFNVIFSAPAESAFSFKVSTRNGTAVVGADFTAPSTELSVAVGQTSRTVDVATIADSIFEATESFFVTLSDSTGNTAVVGNEARGTIFNDDIQIVNSKTVRYVDEDGDLVTVKTTKGALSVGSNGVLTFVDAPNSTVGGKILQMVDFTGNSRLFNGTSLSITADEQPGFRASGLESDGKVNVGWIRGANANARLLSFTNSIDFGKIVVEGDVAKITGGDSVVDASVGRLEVDSLGLLGLQNLPSESLIGSGNRNTDSLFRAAVNSVLVHGDVEGSLQVLGDEFGNLRNLTIEGTLRGGETQLSGSIQVTGTLKSAMIGDIVGGSGLLSGAVFADDSTRASIGSVHVLGGILGGGGERSGGILASKIGKVVVEESVTGGSSSLSGSIVSFGALGTVKVGGSVVGGQGGDSGRVEGAAVGRVELGGSIKGGAGSGSGAVISGNDLRSISVAGDLIGGAGAESGSISARSAIGSVEIGGSIMGDAGNAAATGAVSAGAFINSVVVKKSIIGGGGANSGSVEAGGRLGKIEVGEAALADSGAVADVLIGGAGKQSGRIHAQQLLNVVTLSGSILGGTGVESGMVMAGAVNDTTGATTAVGNIKQILVEGDLKGAAGNRSGSIRATGSLAEVNIGVDAATGDVLGGLGVASGTIDIGTGSTSKIVVTRDVVGGKGASSGGIQSNGTIKSLVIGRDLVGGSSFAGSGQSDPTSLVKSGYVQALQIATLTVGRDVRSGNNDGVGLADSGSIRVSQDLANLNIGGNIVGNAKARVVIAAGGGGANHSAIGKLTVAHDASYVDILGGYGFGATVANPLGATVTADAQIGEITIGGNLKAANVVASIGTGPDGVFGSDDDKLIGEGQVGLDDPKVISTIARLQIGGTVAVTEEGYGVVAQEVKQLLVTSLPVSTIADGDATTQEVQQIDTTGATSFRLIFGSQITAALPAGSSATVVQNALNSLETGGVEVEALTPGVYKVTFTTAADRGQIIAQGTFPPLQSGPGNDSRLIGGSTNLRLLEL